MKPFVISDEVGAALTAGRPVVALETTIVSHGMPWPENLETALAVEEAWFRSARFRRAVSLSSTSWLFARGRGVLPKELSRWATSRLKADKAVECNCCLYGYPQSARTGGRALRQAAAALVSCLLLP